MYFEPLIDLCVYWCVRCDVIGLIDTEMDAETFRVRGKQMVDYIANYLLTIGERRVLPEVQPGYLRDMLPNIAPSSGEDWQSIMNDVEHAIMPGVGRFTTYWCFSV